jgi:hypothetical protein
MESVHRSLYGTVTKVEADPLMVQGRPVDSWLVRYRPPAELIRYVPEGSEIQMRCYEDDDNIRRYVPAHGYEPFIREGFRIGMAILQQNRFEVSFLHQDNDLRKHARHSYRAMYQAFDLVRGLSEHATVQFNYSRSLFITPSARGEDGRENILPECLFASDRREIETIHDLASIGTQFAEEHGISNPKRRVQIQHALFEAAKNDPLLNLREEQVETLIRCALFSNEPNQEWERNFSTMSRSAGSSRFRSVLIRIVTHLPIGISAALLTGCATLPTRRKLGTGCSR